MRDQGGGRRGMELQCRIIRVTHVAVQMGHFVRSNKILLAVYSSLPSDRCKWPNPSGRDTRIKQLMQSQVALGVDVARICDSDVRATRSEADKRWRSKSSHTRPCRGAPHHEGAIS